MTDPWLTQASESENTENVKSETTFMLKSMEFEDNFTNLDNSAEKDNSTHSDSNDLEPLPDSASYLQGLERKLEKIKKGSKLIEALAEKRQDCMRALLNEDIDGNQNNNETLVALDTPVDNVDSRVQEICRHLQPVQPITIGETVHIVQYDQLEEQREVAGNVEEGTDTPDK